MKIFILLFFVFYSFVYSSDLLQVRISKIHGLITFVHSLSGQGHIVKSYKSIYENNIKNEEIKEFTEIVKKVYSAKIYGYKNEIYLYNVIKEQSTFVTNLSQLQKIIAQYKTSISDLELDKYYTILKNKLPIYEKLIYNDSLLKLQARKQELEVLIRKSDFEQLIYSAAHFYGVANKDIKTIYLSLYPITQGRSTMAFMLGNVESIGVLVNKKKLNLHWLLSATVFHEIVHTFYKQNYENIKKILYENNFIKYKEQIIFNESVATAFGAGWAFYKLTGLQSNGSWYNNATYDSIAKKIYPVISQYINDSKEIDNDFVKRCYAIYKSLK